MAEHPKVFISYSHDSPEHKRWVLELGAKLRHNGVDVVLDRWDLTPGDNFTQFMEAGVRDLDWVLVICTDNYVRKANDRKGGVGYEVQIVTAQLVENLGIDKFIPIIRHASGQEKTPTFLGGRVYIDFTDDSQFNEKFNDLLHKLYEVPVEKKPPLGESLFAQLSSGQGASSSEETDTQLPEIPAQVESASDAYAAAVKLARAGDMFGWRQLLKQIKPRVFDSLVQWWQYELEGKLPEGRERFEVVNKAVEIISPLISVILVGVESRREQFRDQKSILDDLLNSARWNRANVSVNLRHTLGYIYHSLHGSLSLYTNQLDLALSLARVKAFDSDKKEHLYVWERSRLMAGDGSLGPDSWEYLSTAYKRGWEWLAPIFGDESEYRTSLVAYYMALNIHELASRIASDQQDMLNAISVFSLKVPLTFLSEDHRIIQRAITLLRDQEELTKLWTCLNVTRQQMESSWGNWIRTYEQPLWGGNERQHNSRARYDLIDIFRYFFEVL